MFVIKLFLFLMKLIFSIRSLIILIPLVLTCSPPKSPHLTIATAANTQFAMKELSEAFTNETNIKCDLILSSSGKLTAQIVEGAPYDIFISADMKFPNELWEKEKTYQQPTVYAYGKLVLWTSKKEITPSLDILASDQVKHIAIANPKTAPYGKAAIEALKYYKVYDQIKDKLVFGESISQTNQFITSKSADIGITAQSIVLAPTLKNEGTWISIDQNSYEPIAQGAVVLKEGRRNKNKLLADQFFEFLFSEKAKEILKDYGYLVDVEFKN